MREIFCLLKKIEVVLNDTLPDDAEIVSLYIGKIRMDIAEGEEANAEQTLKIISNTKVFSSETCEKINHLVMLDLFKKMEI